MIFFWKMIARKTHNIWCSRMNKYYLQTAMLFVSLLLPAFCFAWSGRVVHVADGDTITVMRRAEGESPPLWH